MQVETGKTMSDFKRFVNKFKKDPDDEVPYYLQLLYEVIETEQTVLNLVSLVVLL